jgi:hypothetical protein
MTRGICKKEVGTPHLQVLLNKNFKRGEKMRVKTTIVSSLLCALLVLGFALSAQANETYQVSTSPLNAIKNGAAEVMGTVALTSAGTAGTVSNNGITTNDQITITYSQSAITPGQAATAFASVGGVANLGNGIIVTATAGFPTYTVTVTPNVPSIGGTLTITFTGSVASLGSGIDQITVNGVRSSVVGRAVSSIVITQFTGSPAGSSNFVVTSAPTVAFVVDNFSITGGTLRIVPICQPGSATSLSFTIKEESLSTWVQYVAVTGWPLTNGRSLPPLSAAGNANAQVHFVLAGLPTGVTVNWPGASSVDPTILSELLLVSQTSTGNEAIYQFVTPNQANSDNAVESFGFTFAFASSGTTAGTIVVGVATPPNSIMSLSAQEYPPDLTPFTSLPRFADPLRTAIDVVQFVDCVTNLLFPWVGSLPDFGYDTGIAIANTGYDVGAISPPTVGDPGVIRGYFYPQTFGAAPVAPTPVTTSVIVPGDTWAFPFSSYGASKFGYLIAVCEFRFGHGFAYITQGTIGGTLDTAQGYLALVMNPTQGSPSIGFRPSMRSVGGRR